MAGGLPAIFLLFFPFCPAG